MKHSFSTKKPNINGAFVIMAYTNPIWHADSGYNAILEIAGAFQKSRVLFTAVELDIFNHIGSSKISSVDLAAKIGTDLKATDSLLNALTALKLLDKVEKLFSNTEIGLDHLVLNGKNYIGSLHYISQLWNRWDKLTEAVRSGEPVDYNPMREKDDEWTSDFVNSLFWRTKLESPEVLKYLRFNGVKKMLSLGVGAGLYSMFALKNNPSISAVIFDFPNIISQSKKYFKESGVENRIQTIEGEFLKDDIGEGYDTVIISSLLEQYSIWDDIHILQKVYNSLNLGGSVVIHQYVINDSRTEPVECTLKALNLIVNTKKGDVYTDSDIWVMLKEASFSDIQRYETEFGSYVIIAKKPDFMAF